MRLFSRPWAVDTNASTVRLDIITTQATPLRVESLGIHKVEQKVHQVISRIQRANPLDIASFRALRVSKVYRL
jgi:hypothetical protein